MRRCANCQFENPSDHRFCQQCGRPMDRTGGGSTVIYNPMTAGDETTERILPTSILFANKKMLVIGRSDESDLRLDHPSVSRQHALLEHRSDGLWLVDLGSINGLRHRGRRASTSVRLDPGERVGIGPYLISAGAGAIHLLDSSHKLRLVAHELVKKVRLPNGNSRTLLEHISLAFEPGEFVSFLGPSGSGKSTLMDCLNGRRRATGGQVLANGEDFYRHFDSFRQSLGYVPQRDIVHTQLTVERALYYTARLRLPNDMGETELWKRVEEVLKQMELLPHRGTMVAQLSGGQARRVSLGAELLGGPCLLYIDEATSGLDAGTEARMMRLFRQLADEGKSVLCITHTLDNVDRCHLALVLVRGRVAYFGPPQDAARYFDVSRLTDVYDRLAELPPEDWERRYRMSDEYAEFVANRVGDDSAAANSPTSTAASIARLLPSLIPSPSGLWHQFRVLTRRYIELTLGDRRSLRLIWLQAPIVAAILLLGFINKPYAQKVLVPRKLSPVEREIAEAVKDLLPPGHVQNLLAGALATNGPILPYRLMVDPRFTYMLLFIVVITVLWFGCNNAAKEIVKEEAVYGRERAVNLGILPYLASKFLVLGVVTAIQAFLIVVVIYGTLGILHLVAGHDMPSPLYQLSYPELYGFLLLVGLAGVALGLLLSAIVNSPDRANALLPYVLIPQIILGGGILAVKEGPLFWIAWATSPVYWGYRAVRKGVTSLPVDSPAHMDYNESLWIPLTALLAQTAGLLLLAALALRNKDRQRE